MTAGADSRTPHKYGERREELAVSLDGAAVDATLAQTAATHAQIEAIEKKAGLFGSLNGLIFIVAFGVLTAAVPLEVFLWHLALK